VVLADCGVMMADACCRALFSEVNKKFPTMPFALRAVDAEQKRFGLVECINHGLLHPYPVLHEKTGELVGCCRTVH
jgi:hypothetical protein